MAEFYRYPRMGYYLETVMNFNGGFNTYEVRCKVRGHTASSYFIELLQPTSGNRHAPGETIWVRKRNVKIDGEKYWGDILNKK